MTVNDLLTFKTQRVMLAQKPKLAAFDGPQEGVIVTADAGAGTVTVTVPAVGGTTYGYQASLARGLDPAAGDRCLVLFVGSGVGNPWVVALTDAPKPDGY